MTIEV